MVLPQDSYLRFGPYLDLMTGIRTALSVNEGIIKVVAPEGCGKTALCRTLASDLKAEGRDVIFFATPPESVEYLHEHIQSELGLPRDKNFTRSLTRYLLARTPPDNKLILIYDDAEKISKEIFILIRLLNNIHDQSETLVSQVICGTGKLDRVFDDPDLRSLTQYLNQSFTLAPMTREDLDDFYSGYRKLAGITGREMSNKELTDMYMVSKGLPGKTFDLLEKHYSLPAGDQVAAAPTDSPAAAPHKAASVYAGGADEPPDEDDAVAGTAKVYFKVVLSFIVLAATAVLAVVLTGDNRAGNPRLAELLADDSPLYLDEVDPENAAPVSADTVSIPVVGGRTDAVPDDSVAGENASAAGDAVTAPPADLAAASETAADATGSNDSDPLPASDTPALSAAPADTAGGTGEDDAADTNDPGTVAADDAGPADPQLAEAETAATGESPQQDVVEAPAAAIAAPGEVLEQVVQDWLDAWERGDYGAYLAAYHDDFESPYHESREAWEIERESRVDGVTGIDVSADRFEVLESGDREARLRFWLYYMRGNYADETLKEIVLRREDGAWKILGERNLELIVR